MIARSVAAERSDLTALGDVTVTAANGRTVPLAQVASIGWGLEQPVVWRRNRTPMLLVRADTVPGVEAPVATASILRALDAVKAALPPGYRIEAAGAVEEAGEAVRVRDGTRLESSDMTEVPFNGGGVFWII